MVFFSSVHSFLHIIGSVACLPNLPNQESYMERAIVEISPWSMAQQFGVRVVAQLTFAKLWSAVVGQQRLAEALQAKYSVLHACLDKSVQFCSDKSAKNITDDFYLSVFRKQGITSYI